MSVPSLWPGRIGVVRLGGGRFSLLVDRRALTVASVFFIIAAAVTVWSLSVGESHLAFSDVVAALTGNGDEGVRRIVVEWRLPRVLLAVAGGACLALSGAVFQTITRNPLGSPDIIGFNTGAYTGALVSLLVIDGGYFATVLGALLGGIATGLVVYVLALRNGLHGYRLIVVGIGISSLLAAVNSYLMITARVEEALAAAVWGAGSLSTATWTDVVPVLAILVVLTPALLVVHRSARLLLLGDEAARSRGVALEPLRLLLLVLGVALTAAVTAVAGPIAFVSLLAPQLAIRLARTPAIPLMTSAFVGAALLAVSDLIARTVIAPSQLPVGVVTITVGGAYLVWLLITQARKA